VVLVGLKGGGLALSIDIDVVTIIKREIFIFIFYYHVIKDCCTIVMAHGWTLWNHQGALSNMRAIIFYIKLQWTTIIIKGK